MLVALLAEAGFEILVDSELMPETFEPDVILCLLIEPVVDEPLVDEPVMDEPVVDEPVM